MAKFKLNKYEKASTGLGVASVLFPLFSPLFLGLSAGLGAKGAHQRVSDSVSKTLNEKTEQIRKAYSNSSANVNQPVSNTTITKEVDEPLNKVDDEEDILNYFKGGRIDGAVIKGRTRGRIL